MKNYADFIILLSPSDKVKAQVREHKLYAAEIIGNYESMNSIAHISIKKMHRQKSFLTEPAIRALTPKLAAIAPITLTIDGFDYFNHGEDFKTIYAKIRSSPENTAWFKTLKKHLNLKEFMVPHITIARNIPISDFNRLWPHFKAIKWNETFTISELTVLQKETFAPFAKWEIFTTLPFNGKPLDVVQPKPSLVKPLQNSSLQGKQISLF
ncbi:MAG: 2'-5' RNA ligase family protein [Mucilaginibacter sp.]